MYAVPAREADYLLGSYAFTLPAGLIAQHPPALRGNSRLYALDRSAAAGAASDACTDFARLPELLPPRSLLVANNSRVIPARLSGRRAGGGRLECLLLTPPPLLEAAAEAVPGAGAQASRQAEAELLLRPAKKVQNGLGCALGEGLSLTVLEKLDYGRVRALLRWEGSLLKRLRACGSLPLPPYIRRGAAAADEERYQTVYAAEAKSGSLAAPTAGLHFTPAIRQRLLEAGHEWAELTLFVGYGTFSPVRAADIRRHVMHAEYAELPASTVERILRAGAEGRAVVAVGTTSARVLEGVAEKLAESREETAPLAPWRGWLDCFLYPGRPVRITDALLTNFHLPESSLLMLASAFTGRERLLAAYARAIQEGFRFFSYGDAMLIR